MQELKNRWKKVFEDEGSDFTHRLEVPGGFLYRNVFIIAGSYHVTMSFVPAEKCLTCSYPLVKVCAALSCKASLWWEGFDMASRVVEEAINGMDWSLAYTAQQIIELIEQEIEVYKKDG